MYKYNARSHLRFDMCGIAAQDGSNSSEMRIQLSYVGLQQPERSMHGSIPGSMGDYSNPGLSLYFEDIPYT